MAAPCRAPPAALTWGTVQLFLGLAAALRLHLCPLAKEGETDVTCKAAPEAKAGQLAQSQGLWLEHKAKPYPSNWEQAGPLLCPEHRGTAHPLALHIPWTPSACPSKPTNLSTGCSEERIIS